MLSNREIEQGLYDLAEQFKNHMRHKEYAQAKKICKCSVVQKG